MRTAEPSLTQTLARFVYELRFEDLPPPVVEKAKVCLLDSLACAFGGWDLPWSAAAVRAARGLGGSAEATIWVHGGRVGAGAAALANAALAHSILQEDTHVLSSTHMGTMVIPAALAVGERERSSGREVLTAVVAGYDVTGRIGRWLGTPKFLARKHRPSAQFGAFGCAAAAGRLAGLTVEELAHALGLAASAGGGPSEFANAGTPEFALQNGLAARGGVDVALLAGYGATAAPTVLEGAAGLVQTLDGDRALLPRIVEGLGHEFELLNVVHKPFPTCSLIQPGLQATAELVRRYRLVADDVDRVVVRTSRQAKECAGVDNAGPFQSRVQAQMSHQFGQAAVLAFGDVTLAALRRYDDPKLAALARRVEVEVYAKGEAAFPARQTTEVEIRTRDGRVLVYEQEDLRNPEPSDVVRKFRTYGAEALGAAQVEELLRLVERLETLEDIGPLLAACVAQPALRPAGA